MFVATRRLHLCDVCITSLVYRVYRFGPIYFTVVFLLSHSVRLSRAHSTGSSRHLLERTIFRSDYVTISCLVLIVLNILFLKTITAYEPLDSMPVL